MSQSKDLYYAKMNRPTLKAIVCAVTGHDIYTAQGWYFYERGCRRCGLMFLHQWDLFGEPPASQLPQKERS